MGGLFSYESKPMQILMFLGDVIILNVMYLIFCIPIFSIGAAQAGMFTACKVLLDKEDDSSPYAAFWRGFTSGFGTVTIAWLVMTVVTALVAWMAGAAMMLKAPIWLSCIAIALPVLFQTLVPAFHSRFGCTWWQLIRNSWFLLFAHPLRSIATVAMIWVPLVCFVCMKTYDFMALTPIWGLLYFSTVFCFGTVFLRKPFNTLTEHYNETHGIKPPEPLPASTTTCRPSKGLSALSSSQTRAICLR
jgi:hypothetical protein